MVDDDENGCNKFSDCECKGFISSDSVMDEKCSKKQRSSSVITLGILSKSIPLVFFVLLTSLAFFGRFVNLDNEKPIFYVSSINLFI